MKETYGVFLYVTIKGGTRHLERKQSLAHAQINSSEKNKHYLLTTISHNLPSNTPGVSYSLGNSSQLLGLKMLRRVWLWVIWFNAQNEIIAGHRTLSDQNCSLSGCTWNVQITCPAEVHWVTTIELDNPWSKLCEAGRHADDLHAHERYSTGALCSWQSRDNDLIVLFLVAYY